MSIKNHVLRYVVTSENKSEEIIFSGEKYLPATMMQEGKVLDIRRFEHQVEDIVANYRLKNCPVNFCVPDSSVIVRHITIPEDIIDEEIKGHLYMEIGESIHFPFDDPVLDYEMIEENENGKKILVVAYPHNQLTQLEESLKESGLKPKVADISFLSTYRYYEKMHAQSLNENLLLVDWNKDGINVTAFHKGIPMFSRQMRSGLDSQDWRLKKMGEEYWLEWNGDPQDIESYTVDQLSELKRIMNFYQFSVMKGEASISKVLLGGDWVYLRDIKNRMSQMIDIPVEQLVAMGDDEITGVKYIDTLGLIYKR